METGESKDAGKRESGLRGSLPPGALVGCAAAIIGSLMLYGVLQERIMTRPYGPDGEAGGEGERFTNSLFLVMNNRLAAAVVAAALLLARGDLAQLRNTAPLYKYALVSLSNVAATSCQYEALKWVTFPTQTLFKCGKMVPVMLWGGIISGKSYGVIDYAVAATVAFGCTAFALTGNIAAKRGAASSSAYGIALMASYLGFDAFTSTFQEKLFAAYEMSIYNQMLYVNMASATLSCLGILFTRSALTTFGFITRHPQIVVDAAILSFSAVAGQFAITYTIKNFGALAYATIMTIRQLLSVLVSNLLFQHNMTLAQWAATIAVFGSLLFRNWYNKKAKRPSKSPPPSSLTEQQLSQQPTVANEAQKAASPLDKSTKGGK
mmetsp:Transcript_10491/g.27898  ORF Transcript_10491/g.27898 Transcript_10491/m.27898 type:complete len:378 (+) Transcript_10491:75-1208(+)|eukprot:CAMPEP_0185832888 /NCGR_PEP_ID=MMETSP1353-20130828/2352_1 /TAXON_ID=1077150 /ORGANISM="Erythrolobus australicus, Strain CCMP3124" /LENGTH=377 /DNA_ID=CAMNT_0028531119 /DNA_START=55 /DNA_END=1188 /DNA_ORIENTATION=+